MISSNTPSSSNHAHHPSTARHLLSLQLSSCSARHRGSLSAPYCCCRPRSTCTRHSMVRFAPWACAVVVQNIKTPTQCTYTPIIFILSRPSSRPFVGLCSHGIVDCWSPAPSMMMLSLPPKRLPAMGRAISMTPAYTIRSKFCARRWRSNFASIAAMSTLDIAKIRASAVLCISHSRHLPISPVFRAREMWGQCSFHIFRK